MKKTKILIASAILGIATFVAIAADHIDAPAVTGTTSDITDYFAFQGQDTDNIAFVANVQGLLASGSATANAEFDENVLIEFNIDTDGDAVENLIIQAIPRDGIMYFFGPYEPNSPGLNSTINVLANSGAVDITAYGENAITSTFNGMQFFAGPRDDPFFFDFTRFTQILTPGDDDGDGEEETGFLPEGEATDLFAGSNVLSVVVEVPKTLIGGSGTINTWVETKSKQ